MITTTYDVSCDAPAVEDPDERCAAEFSYESFQLDDLAGLRRQLDGRGWTYRDGKFRCPLHDRNTAEVGS